MFSKYVCFNNFFFWLIFCILFLFQPLLNGQKIEFVIKDAEKKPISNVRITNQIGTEIGNSDNEGKASNGSTDKISSINFIKDGYSVYALESDKIKSIIPNTPYEIFLETPMQSTIPVGNSSVLSNSSFSINFEEDFLYFPDNQDRNYTGGVSLNFTNVKQSKINKYTVENFDSLISLLCGNIGLHPHKDRLSILYSFSLGVTGFTPNDLGAKYVIRKDRPYASLTYISFRKSSISKKTPDHAPEVAKSLATSEFTFGFLGLHIYHYLQSGIHSVNRFIIKDTVPLDARGWSNQISNGGEPTFNYTYSKRFRAGSKNNSVVQFTYGYRLSMGYFTGLSPEINIRIGHNNSNPIYFNTTQLGFAAAGDNEKKFELFAFGSFRPVMTVRNNLLSGQFRPSLFTLEPITETNLLMLEWDYGIGYNYSSKLGIYLFLRQRTPEGRESANYPQRIHSWGGIYLNWYI